MADDRARMDDINLVRHFGRVRCCRKVCEPTEGVVLAFRQRSLPAHFEYDLLLFIDYNLLDTAGICFASRPDMYDETVPKMRGRSGVVYTVVLIIRRSRVGGLYISLSRFSSITEVDAEDAREQAIELAEDGGTIGTINPSTQVCSANPGIEERRFMLA